MPKKAISIFTKNLMFSVVIIIFSSVSFFTTSLNIQKKILKENLVNQAIEIGNTWIKLMDLEEIKNGQIDYRLESPMNQKLIQQLTLLSDTNKNIGQAYFFKAEIIDGNKTIAMANPENILDAGIKMGEEYEQPKEWLKAAKILLKTKQVAHTGVYTDAFGSWITTLHPILNDNGKVMAIFAIDMSASILEKGQSELIVSLFIFLFILLTVTISIQYIGLRKIFVPLSQLLKGIKQVSTGNFEVEIPNNHIGELKELTENFNVMAREIKRLFATLNITATIFNEKISFVKGANEVIEIRTGGTISEALDVVQHIKEKTLLIEKIQSTDKMNAISQLGAVLAHEIMNPLTTIKGYLQYFLVLDPDDKKREAIDLMLQEIKTIEYKIGEFIDFSKPNHYSIQTFRVSEVVKTVLGLVQFHSISNIHVNVEIEDSLTFSGSKTDIKQVLLNILQNSVEAMEKGGILTVRAYEQSSNLVFEIIDSGIGMTEEEISRLGTLFYSTKVKGTGMGIVTVYHIIGKMRGTIQINSTKGKGTHITIILPISQ
ncbi:ATP-binding protein [Bacillus sp. CGMCC 1.16607]|uniref:ATP-binding protein n=1 Tax=Bacillus sp. CGMCC 1.16607 TaxID=3351842 RepID=UPI00362A28A5